MAQIDSTKSVSSKIDSNVLVVINSKVTGTIRELKKDINSIVPADMIQSINVLNGKNAVVKYGEKGKSGVIEIILKESLQIITMEGIKDEAGEPVIPDTKQDNDPNKIFEKVEIEATFPGGDQNWRRYLEKTLNPDVPINNFSPPGKYTVLVQFIVGKEGDISDVKAITNHGFGMEQEVIRVITKGPKWTPAIQDGRKVMAYRKQPVTFLVMPDGFELSTYSLTARKENTVILTGLDAKPEDIDITMPGATITRGENGVYKITPASPGRVLLTAWITKKGKKQELGKVSMLVKE